MKNSQTFWRYTISLDDPVPFTTCHAFLQRIQLHVKALPLHPKVIVQGSKHAKYIFSLNFIGMSIMCLFF